MTNKETARAIQAPFTPVAAAFHLVVYAFDLLHLNGADLRPLPLRERRQKVVGLDKPLPCLFVIDQFDRRRRPDAVVREVQTRGRGVEEAGRALRERRMPVLGQIEVRNLERRKQGALGQLRGGTAEGHNHRPWAQMTLGRR